MFRRSSIDDRALRGWGDALRRTRLARHRRQRHLLLIAAASVLVSSPALVSPIPRLVWNASASAPIGLYRVMPGAPVRTGDMVVARMPVSLRRLADERHYLPLGVALVKRVAAVAGDHVCAVGPDIVIDGKVVATRLTRDRQGRVLPWWRGCGRLRAGAILLLMTDKSESFDGRYFGPINLRDVLGKARPLWLP